jgi:hypothetical protein
MRCRGFLCVAILACGFTVAGCAVQRARVAQDAQGKMVGLTREQVLACMGPPNTKAAEGTTEVWSYASGDGSTTVVGTGMSNTNATISGNRSSATGTASTLGTSIVTARQRYCTVNVTMADGRVARVNYLGPTGGLLTAGEQCAYVVHACVQ